jgi:hypothetical protein
VGRRRDRGDRTPTGAIGCVKGNQSLRAYYEGAGYRFVADKAFPEIEWAGVAALYEKRLRENGH